MRLPFRGRPLTACLLVIGLLAGLFAAPAAAAPGDVFTIGDAAVTEADANTTITFTVTRTAGTGPSQVDYTTRGGTATAGVDYQTQSGTLLFTALDPTEQVTVTVIGDDLPEPAELFFVDITPTLGGSCADCSATGTINNDDGDPPALTVDNVAVIEGTDATATFTVTLTPASAGTVTVAYTTVNGSATAGQDYTTTSGTLTFTPGQTIKTVAVPVLNDTLDEDPENFFLQLANSTNASIGDATGEATIADEDTPPTVQIVEGPSASEGAGNLPFTVTLDRASGKQVTVDFTTSNGTATAGTDYTATAGTLTFVAGDVSETILVPLTADTADEPDETLTVTLTGPTNASLGTATSTGTIVDDDGVPALSVSDVEVTEGDSGNVTATFTVTLAPTSGKTVTVDYATADATATAAEDYTAKTGTLTFSPGTSSLPVTVEVLSDLLDEPTETFTLVLSDATEASIADPTGTGTIADNDPTPTLSVNDTTITEGHTGTSDATLTVTLSAASGQTVTVNYATANGTATSGSDYDATSGTLTFAPGAPLTQTITVPVRGDAVDEANETLLVNLTAPSNATLADGQGQITINDDDPGPTLSVNDVSVVEGSSGTVTATFTITLTGATDQSVSVDYATADASATSPEDYVGATGTRTFAPGETIKQVAVTVNGDTVPEATEQFLLQLSGATSATITDPEGVGTITTDDGPPPGLTIGDVTLVEGNGGTTEFVFTVTRSGNLTATSTVDFSVGRGTATSGTDYTAVPPGTLVFDPTEATQTITVAVTGDTRFEGNDTFYVDLANPRNASITDGEGLGTITNDDARPTISISPVTVAEGDAGTTDATFAVTLSNASDETVTVDFATAPATASGADFTGRTGTVTFVPGDLSETIVIPVVGDTTDEDDETFTVTLSNPTNGAIGTGSGTATGTITDDDVAPTVSINDVEVTEGNSGSKTITFAVTLSAASGKSVTVDYSTVNGSATAGSDYVGKTGTVTIPAGETSQAVTVVVNGDTVDEANETFTVALATPINATIGDGAGTATITDDDVTPTLSVSDVTVTEGNSATTAATFTITLSGASSSVVTVRYATASGSADVADYQAVSGTLTFAAGETTKTVNVAVTGDTVDEADETFTMVLSNATNAGLGDASGTATIVDDDAAPAAGPTTSEAAQGYSLVGEDGSLYAFGTAKNFGDMKGTKLNQPIIGVAYTPGGNGYWLVAKDGGIFSFGDATFYGSMGGSPVNSPVLGMAATPTGKGYWLFAGDGGIFSFGDAAFFGSMGDQKLNQPVINMEPLASGGGYWLVAADGGIFSFGKADFQGSMGDQKVNQPVFDMTSTDTDKGYWLVARDGGVFSFGDAAPKFYGNPVNDSNPRPSRIIGMDSTPNSTGYWIADANGKVWNYGNAQALGDRYQAANPAPMIGFASVPGAKP